MIVGMYFSGLDFFQTWIDMDKMTHYHLNKIMPCMYIILEVFYLKYSGGNTNVIKLQKITSGQYLILILNLIIKTSCLHADDQPDKERTVCGFWWYNNYLLI